MRKIGAGALVVGLVLAALTVLSGGAPALAKGKHGPVVWGGSSCSYSGRSLTRIRVAPPRAAMDKKLAKKGGRSQYVGVRVVLQGLRAGRWVKVAKRPGKDDYSVTVKVHPRKKKSLRHAKLLTFNRAVLPAAYSSFRVKVTLQWYAYNGHTVRGALSSVSRACVRTKPAPPAHVTRIGSGDGFACALMSDTTMRCWGNGDQGRLGTGTTTSHTRPVKPIAMTGVSSMAVGWRSACGVLPGGRAKCWGNNASGQVGDGTTTNRMAPTAVAGMSGISKIFLGNGSTTCATGVGQLLHCWGADAYGQVGDKGSAKVLKPWAVPGQTVTSDVALGSDQTCALRADSVQVLTCWGYNDHHQLGKNVANDTTHYGPTTMTAAGATGGVASGTAHVCAITAGGAVKCWGAGTSYQLGNGVAADSATPVSPKGLPTGVVQLSASISSTCALANHAVYCWGTNGYGQLGDGTTAAKTTATRVAGLGAVVGVEVGYSTSYAWDAAGHVWAWGDNSYGEFGNGTTTSSTRPVAVSIH